MDLAENTQQEQDNTADPVVLDEKTRLERAIESPFEKEQRLRTEDVESRKQYQTNEPVEYDTWAEGIIQKDGVEYLGDTPVDAALLEQAKDDINLKADLIGKYEASRPAPEGSGAITAFTTASGEFDAPAFEKAVGEERYNDLKPRAVRIQQAQQSLLSRFENMGMEQEVAELLTNDILEYKGVVKETLTRFKQAGRFIGMAVPDFVFSTLPSAVMSTYRTGDLPGGAEFMSEYDIIKEDFENTYSTWKNFLTENVPALDIADSFNASIHSALKEKYEGEKYESLAFERKSDGEFALNEEGEKIKKVFVKPSDIQDMLDATYNTLSKWQKFGVDVTEEGLWAATTGPIGMARGVSKVDKIMSYKNSPKYAKLLENTDDPEEILAIVNKNGAKEKADSFFEIGVVQRRVDNELKYSRDRIKAIDDELKTSKDITEKTRNELIAEKTQLVNTARNARLTFKTLPYVKDVGESALIIGSGTALGRELNLFSDDPEASAAISNMLMSFGGYRIGYGGKKLGRRILSASGGALKYGVPSIFEMGRTIASNIPVAGPILVDGTMKNIEAALGTGVKLNEQQRENIRNLIKLHQKLEPNTRAQSLRHMDETAALHKKIVGMVPENQQARMNELMLQTYGNTFGIVTLAAAGELNRGKIDLETLSKFELQDMEADFADMEKNFLFATEALGAMKNIVMDIDDVPSQKIVKSFIAAREEGLSKLAEKIEKTNLERLKKLDNLENYVIKFGPRDELDEDMLLALEAHRRQITKLAKQVYNPTEFLQKTNTQLKELVDSSLERAKNLRDTEFYVEALNEATQALHLSKTNRLKMLGDEIYTTPRELAKKSGPISLRPFVDDVIAQEGVDGVKRFFNASSVLYTGSEGKKVKKALETMVEGAISKRNLKELHDKLIDAAETGAEKNKFREMGILDLAVAMMTAKDDAGNLLNPTFNPFMAADPYDLELVRRAFKRAGSTAHSSGDLEKHAAYGRYVDKLDEVVQGQATEEYFTAIGDARKQYEMQVGLPQSPKLMLDKFEKIKVRRVNELGFGMKLKNVYSENPTAIFDDFSEAVISSLMPTKTAKMFGPSKNKLPLLVDNLTASYGQFSNKHGEFVFDLTTEKGKDDFRDLQNILQEVIYSETGARFLEKYKAIKDPQSVAGISGSLNPNLTNNAINTTDDLNASFILEEGGDIVQQPILDVVEAVSVRDDLVTSIKKSPIIKRAFDSLKVEFESFKKDNLDKIKLLDSKAKRGFEVTDRATRSMSSADFADNFIFGPEGGELGTLKKEVTSVLRASGMSPKDADDSFQTVAVYHTMVGLFERAGRGNVSGKVTTREAGEKVTEALFSPEVVLGELQKPAVRSNLEEILDPDHIDFIEGIMQHLNDSKTAVNVRGATGDYIGIGLAGKVSRVYNAVKGVVNPAYIASEYAITAAKAGQISMMKLALSDKAAAEVLHKFLKTPNLTGGNDMKKFDNILKNFFFTELAQEGQKIVLEGEGDLIPGLEGMAVGAGEIAVDAAEATVEATVDFFTTSEDEEQEDEQEN